MEIVNGPLPPVMTSVLQMMYWVVIMENVDVEQEPNTWRKKEFRVFGEDAEEVIAYATQQAGSNLVAVGIEFAQPGDVPPGTRCVLWIHGFVPLTKDQCNSQRFLDMKKRAARV